ncbi:putative DNA repair protein DNA polymerase, kappa, partial [Emiliania huxleyi CCMP1516]|uniref:UmuC domain-containing protein n=2 Tax=Emiliania huxleyi TaxID=2903 RepID=A0A0D3JLY0_EMIH1
MAAVTSAAAPTQGHGGVTNPPLGGAVAGSSTQGHGGVTNPPLGGAVAGSSAAGSSSGGPSSGGPSFSAQARALYVSSSAKAGMDGVDSEKIAEIVLQTAANSPFTAHQRKLDRAVDRRVAKLLAAKRKVSEPERAAARATVAARRADLEASRRLERVCVVVDFDQFYAAVAMRDRPELAERPLAVGGALVLTANYVARRWGVRSGQPGFVAKELCRQLTFVPAEYEKYAEVAATAMEVYREYDPAVSCGMGYDECSLDLTHYLRRRVRDATGGLTLSARRRTALCFSTSDECLVAPFDQAGIAPNFLLAKMGADVNKPDGQHTVSPTVEAVLAFLSATPTRKAPPPSAAHHEAAPRSCATARLYLGISRLHLGYISATPRGYISATSRLHLGYTSWPERGGDAGAMQKGISFSDTFGSSDEPAALRRQLWTMCEGLGASMLAAGLVGEKLTLRLKDSSFEVRSRAAPRGAAIGSAGELYARALPLLEREL